MTASGGSHRIRIARAEYKFSCAHMTVFADGTKERLHGHNYTVAVTVEVERVDIEAMIPFATIKKAIAELCAVWKEHVLLATGNPWFELVRGREAGGEGDGELEFRLCGQRYVLPREDAVLLPIDNVSVEALAAHVAELLRERLVALPEHATAMEVTVEESPGQGASCTVSLRDR